MRCIHKIKTFCDLFWQIRYYLTILDSQDLVKPFFVNCCMCSCIKGACFWYTCKLWLLTLSRSPVALNSLIPASTRRLWSWFPGCPSTRAPFTWVLVGALWPPNSVKLQLRGWGAAHGWEEGPRLSGHLFLKAKKPWSRRKSVFGLAVFGRKGTEVQSGRLTHPQVSPGVPGAGRPWCTPVPGPFWGRAVFLFRRAELPPPRRGGRSAFLLQSGGVLEEGPRFSALQGTPGRELSSAAAAARPQQSGRLALRARHSPLPCAVGPPPGCVPGLRELIRREMHYT